MDSGLTDKTSIRLFSLRSKTVLDKISHEPNQMGVDWPVVYLEVGDKEAYVGETQNAAGRTKQHLDEGDALFFSKIYILFNSSFNKSVILDLEHMLIERMSCDKKFELVNLQKGQSEQHDYYNRGFYRTCIRNIWLQLEHLKLVNHKLEEIENKSIFKYSPYKSLNVEQMKARNDLLLEIANDIENPTGKLKIVIVEGAAGTGKSVLAVSLLHQIAKDLNTKVSFEGVNFQSKKYLSKEDEEEEETAIALESFKPDKILSKHQNDSLQIAFVCPVPAFRKTMREIFHEDPLLRTINVLGPADVAKAEKPFDVLIVDESHRLSTGFKISYQKSYQNSARRLGLDPKKTTQLDWMKKQTTKVLVLMHDGLQNVKESDVQPFAFEEMVRTKEAALLPLKTQMRVLAGQPYIDYWESLFRNRPLPKNTDFIRKSGYDFRLFEHAKDLQNAILKQNDKQGLSRVVAGLAFDWKKRNRDVHKKYNRTADFEIEGNYYSWNSFFDGWATDPQTKTEIGCIYTCQGYDFNIGGVFIGPDVTYDPIQKKIVIDPTKSIDQNAHSKGHEERAKENIIHAYLVLLSRGINGTYVYAYDPALRAYLSQVVFPDYVEPSEQEETH
jgi:DUF2075 family protein